MFGKIDGEAETPKTVEEWYNVERLAIAIAKHETAYGTTGVGKTKNNLCGIRRHGQFESYGTQAEALADCMSVVEKYRGSTIYGMSRIWTTTEQDYWYNNVNKFYLNP